MIKFDNFLKKNIKEHHPNRPDIPDHPYRISTVGDSASGKTNVLLNLINHKPDIGKLFLYAKYP